MTFGRPASIPQDYIKVDLPGDFPASEHEITLSPKGEGHTKNISVPFFTKTMYLNTNYYSCDILPNNCLQNLVSYYVGGDTLVLCGQLRR